MEPIIIICLDIIDYILSEKRIVLIVWFNSYAAQSFKKDFYFVKTDIYVTLTYGILHHTLSRVRTDSHARTQLSIGREGQLHNKTS